MPLRVHVSLPVSDLDASIAFYENLFATKVSKRRDDYANFRLDEPGIHLALNVSPKEAETGADRHHFGVELDDHKTLSTWTKRLVRAGKPIKEEAEAGCCYAKADKTWASDPDGHAWELWVRTGEYDAREPKESGCCEPEEALAESSAAESSGCC